MRTGNAKLYFSIVDQLYFISEYQVEEYQQFICSSLIKNNSNYNYLVNEAGKAIIRLDYIEKEKKFEDFYDNFIEYA